MTRPRALILRAPGTNCDEETAFAFEQAGASAQRVHVNRLLQQPQFAAEFQILCLPGGFSYGDDIAAGRILANQMRHHLADVLEEFKSQDKLILGICNGFQVLIKSGLLLSGDDASREQATLTWNNSGRYEDRWVYLRVSSSKSPLFAGLETLYLPVAHAEGKFVAREASLLREWEASGQIVLRYALPDGAASAVSTGDEVPYPGNPNGSQANVAGVCDATGRVCGLMPHPERHIEPTQHPRWTRGEGGEVSDGLHVFRNAVAYFK